MTLQTALQQGVELLESAEVIAPRLTTEVLLAHALGRRREYLYAHPEHELAELEWLHFGRYLHERMQGKPTQFITGRQEFYGREFRVTRDVLIPRPETEGVAEAVMRLAPRAKSVLDVGTGSGVLAVTLALEAGSASCGTDISRAALAVAADNARRLGARVHFVCCDLLTAMASARFDVIVSNPPYVPLKDEPGLQREVRDWEPRVALFGGDDGFAFYRRIVADAPRALIPGGWLIMELGLGSYDHVAALLSGWAEVRVEPDLAGIPRVIAARR